MQGFYPALQRTFSTARLHAYHDGEPDPSTLDVTARYTHNMEVAMRLSPALHVLEVALRNNMPNAFSAKYGTGACLLTHCDPFDGALSAAAFAACRTKVQPCFEPEKT
ncbi:hypothetical protein [Cupriavidus gilardii]|uniref:hypothetical protein n=1 Tax=Cupriavidus gilardii TaxID=82541 RepID=UPI001580B8D8|nr:hypothetical protein [Cupriavidus gilardii]MCT9074104.1 hypothetical protein [Cupriavidus gilardii]QKS61820.1 hypothetical protein FOB47_08300 [Cupriavidus gilardii]